MRRLFIAVFVGLVIAAVAFAQQKVDQGKPGTQGCWPVCTQGSSGTGSDGGATSSVWPAPCRVIVQTNDAGIGTTATPVPGTPATGRIWIRICNSILNSSSTICTCSAWTCPQSAAVGAVGDPLATGDCVTYPMTTQDGGVPCCVCNGAGSFLPATECLP